MRNMNHRRRPRVDEIPSSRLEVGDDLGDPSLPQLPCRPLPGSRPQPRVLERRPARFHRAEQGRRLVADLEDQRRGDPVADYSLAGIARWPRGSHRRLGAASCPPDRPHQAPDADSRPLAGPRRPARGVSGPPAPSSPASHTPVSCSLRWVMASPNRSICPRAEVNRSRRNANPRWHSTGPAALPSAPAWSRCRSGIGDPLPRRPRRRRGRLSNRFVDAALFEGRGRRVLPATGIGWLRN
jgi:hypothetical protein